MQSTNAFLMSTLNDTPYVGPGLTYIGQAPAERPRSVSPAHAAAADDRQSTSSLPASAAATRALGWSAAAAADEERRRSHAAAGTSAQQPGGRQQPQGAGVQPGAAQSSAEAGQPGGAGWEMGAAGGAADAKQAEQRPPSRQGSAHRRSRSWSSAGEGRADPAHVSPGSASERPDPRRLVMLASRRMAAAQAAAQAGGRRALLVHASCVLTRQARAGCRPGVTQLTVSSLALQGRLATRPGWPVWAAASPTLDPAAWRLHTRAAPRPGTGAHLQAWGRKNPGARPAALQGTRPLTATPPPS